MLKSYAVKLKHFFSNNQMYNPSLLPSLSVETFMVNFGIFYIYLKKEELFPNKDTYFLETTLTEATTQYKQFSYFFSTN